MSIIILLGLRSKFKYYRLKRLSDSTQSADTRRSPDSD
jgi:hypothetical protein